MPGYAQRGGARGGASGGAGGAGGAIRANVDGGAKANIDSGAKANLDGGAKANVQSSSRDNDGPRSAFYRGDNNRGNNDGANLSARDALNVGGKSGVSVGRDGRDYIGRNRIGDSDFDRFGIGRMDDARYRTYSGNQWRYKRYGSDWFYWMPAGYWMFYGDGRWNRYEPDSYATYYYGDTYQQPQQPATTAGFNGPYYEDSSGFYHMNGNQRVYDPQIQRVANVEGNVQR